MVRPLIGGQALAIQQIEQTRAAEWDLSNPTDEITNINLNARVVFGAYPLLTVRGYTWTNLDLPVTSTNYIRATNFVTIQGIYGNYNNSTLQQVRLKFVRIDTVWPFTWRGTTRLFTNTICSYIAPDN
jgi:hypothetical protein